MNKISIDVRITSGTFRLATISHNFLDGSVYLSLVRENENTSGYSKSINLSDMSLTGNEKVQEVNKIVKVSCHTSGIVNYHNLSVPRLFNEPLYDVTQPFLLVEYLVKDLSKLLTSTDQDNVVELPGKFADQFYSFSFFLCKEPMSESTCISYYDGLFILCMKVNVVNGIEGDREMPFYYLTPSSSNTQKKQSESACVLFHQKINDTRAIIIYKPNAHGLYTMIFHETRRSTPVRDELIKFIDPDYKAEFTSIKSHYAKFYVRHKRSGKKIIKENNLIEGFIFNNRL
jgi:hypothetical protein